MGPRNAALQNIMTHPGAFANSGLIDFLRESTAATLDLSRNLTSARSPDEFLTIWTKFVQQQSAAAERYTYGLMGQTAMTRPQASAEAKSKTPAAPAPSMADHAEAIAQHDTFISDLQDEMDALKAKFAELADKLAQAHGQEKDRPPKIKFSFGEPPHTGWTPTKVVVLGQDAQGNLIELPSVIEEGGFSYLGAPSFWIAIG